jgi:hypothetical protein
MVLPLMFSCKKDKEEPNISNTPPPAELRQASIEVAVSGSYTDSFVIHQGSEDPNESLTGQYDLNQNTLTITSNRTTTSTLSLVFVAVIPSLTIGNYALIVGEDESVGSYSNSNIPTGLLTLTIGNLNITVVDAVPASLGSSSTRYVSGTFFFEMENEDGSESVEVNGSFTDVYVTLF